jgi:hypothetical protein
VTCQGRQSRWSVLALAGFGGLDVGVDRARDGQVSPLCLVLVDDRSAFAVVAHPGHHILEARTAGSGEVVPGVPEIVKVQASAPIARTACGQADILLKLLRRSGPPLAPGKMSASRSGLTPEARPEARSADLRRRPRHPPGFACLES